MKQNKIIKMSEEIHADHLQHSGEFPYILATNGDSI
jgi:hypothetical protein